MSTTKKLLLVLITFLLLISTLFIWSSLRKKEYVPTEIETEKNLIEVYNLPKEDWWRVITTEEKASTKIVTNNFDGYQIKIPIDWRVEEKASPSGGLKIFYEDSPELNIPNQHGHIESGILLNILTFKNPDKFSLLDWLAHSQEAKYYRDNFKFEEVKIANQTSFKITRKMEEEGFGKDGEIIVTEIKNSLVVEYFFLGNANKIHKLSCWAQGRNYQKLLSQCEKQIQTFQIL